MKLIIFTMKNLPGSNQFKTLTTAVDKLAVAQEKLKDWLAGELKTLPCGESGPKIQKLKEDIIELKGEVKSNKEHNARQDELRKEREALRISKENKLWALALTCLAGMFTVMAGAGWFALKS